MEKTQSTSKLQYFIKSQYGSSPYSTPRKQAFLATTSTGFYSTKRSQASASERKDLLSTTLTSFGKYRLKTLNENVKPKSISIKKINPPTLKEMQPLSSNNRLGSVDIKQTPAPTARLLTRSKFDDDFGVLKAWKTQSAARVRAQDIHEDYYEDPSQSSKIEKSLKFLKGIESVKSISPFKPKLSPSKFNVQAKVPKKVKELKFKDLDYKAAIQNMKVINEQNSSLDESQVSSPHKVLSQQSCFTF